MSGSRHYRKFTFGEMRVISKNNNNTMSQADLARLMGLHPSTISGMLKANRIPFKTKVAQKYTYKKDEKMLSPYLLDEKGIPIKDEEGEYIPIVDEKFLKHMLLPIALS